MKSLFYAAEVENMEKTYIIVSSELYLTSSSCLPPSYFNKLFHVHYDYVDCVLMFDVVEFLGKECQANMITDIYKFTKPINIQLVIALLISCILLAVVIFNLTSLTNNIAVMGIMIITLILITTRVIKINKFRNHVNEKAIKNIDMLINLSKDYIRDINLNKI